MTELKSYAGRLRIAMGGKIIESDKSLGLAVILLIDQLVLIHHSNVHR
jgi:hypothetical protein